MTKYFSNNFALTNLYKRPSLKSEIVTQMIFGDSFFVSKKTKKWLKIKIKDDNYKGYIQNKNFSHFVKPTHKVSILKANIYKKPSRSKKAYQIPFGSKIRVLDKRANFLKFSKGWISNYDVKKISYREKNLFKKIKDFKNIKYKWGGKSFRGIDCSALIQVCLNFNNKFCPRDAKDQLKYFKRNVQLKDLKKNDLIYWKGHVALALSKKKLIHAYGPMKKTVVMNIDYTIKRIEKSAKLKVLGIKRL